MSGSNKESLNSTEQFHRSEASILRAYIEAPALLANDTHLLSMHMTKYSALTYQILGISHVLSLESEEYDVFKLGKAWKNKSATFHSLPARVYS